MFWSGEGWALWRTIMRDTGHPRNIRTPECKRNEKSVQSLRISRHISHEIGVSKQCHECWSDLKAFPYKIQSMQQLSSDDKCWHDEFCARFSRIIDQVGIKIEDIIFSDKCRVYLNGRASNLKSSFVAWRNQPTLLSCPPFPKNNYMVWSL